MGEACHLQNVMRHHDDRRMAFLKTCPFLPPPRLRLDKGLSPPTRYETAALPRRSLPLPVSSGIGCRLRAVNYCRRRLAPKAEKRLLRQRIQGSTLYSLAAGSPAVSGAVS